MLNQATDKTDVLRSPIGCPGCGLYQECGGLDGDGELWGCFLECDSCDKETCQWTCPKKPIEFWNRIREVGGLPLRGLKVITNPHFIRLPTYIPQIHHGHRRSLPLPEPVVAIPIFNVLKQRNGIYGPGTDDPESFRSRFRLQKNSSVILTSVGKDKHLERLWEFAEDAGAGPALRALGISAITAPNFTFFEDVPRSHTLWNLQRICHMTEYFSNSGIGVVLHLHALTRKDWQFWKSILAENVSIRVVAHEFQTGGRKWVDGAAYLQNIAEFRAS